MIHLAGGTFYSPASDTDLLRHHRQDIYLCFCPFQGKSCHYFIRAVHFEAAFSKLCLVYQMCIHVCMMARLPVLSLVIIFQSLKRFCPITA